MNSLKDTLPMTLGSDEVMVSDGGDGDGQWMAMFCLWQCLLNIHYMALGKTEVLTGRNLENN